MHFISEELELYVERHSQDEPELLVQLFRETHQKVLQPRMPPIARICNPCL